VRETMKQIMTIGEEPHFLQVLQQGLEQLIDDEVEVISVRTYQEALDVISQHIEQIEIGDLVLDTRARQVRRGGRNIELTRREFDVLELLARHVGQVLTKACIFEHIWGYDSGANWEVVKVYVNYVRTKLNAGGKPNLIQSVRGIGYVLRP
jgi:DNA-binding response OmpR family regulator